MSKYDLINNQYKISCPVFKNKEEYEKWSREFHKKVKLDLYKFKPRPWKNPAVGNMKTLDSQ